MFTQIIYTDLADPRVPGLPAAEEAVQLLSQTLHILPEGVRAADLQPPHHV